MYMQGLRSRVFEAGRQSNLCARPEFSVRFLDNQTCRIKGGVI